MMLNPFSRQCKVIMTSSAFWSVSTSLTLQWLLNNVTLQLLPLYRTQENVQGGSKMTGTDFF